ncbi:YjfB family protein [Clostridium estertheticum]|uniref:YjfB family protein n=1 Tax=Clostridium estertheticum TaxID=238834 RepID=UPI001CF5557B|nr:YjfB family protein [Clostridium estertheticum]MCB2356701.1 putative motility protein [Clostridium estertheticum]WAG42771.1 putative motility protein [Clostridium estertheticum]
MDITPLSIAVGKSNIQKHDDIVVTKKASIDTVKENDKQMSETVHNVAIDPNIGQNLDVVAGVQKDKNEAANKQLQQELKWAKDKQKMLNVKEVKLLQMREIAEQGKQLTSLDPKDLNRLNDRLDKLSEQVSAIDSDSKRTKDGRKLE